MNQKNNAKVIIAVLAGVLLIAAVAMLIVHFNSQEPESTEPSQVPTTTETLPPETETTVPEETKPEMLEDMAQLYALNPDIAGWVRIEGTKVDYPVMFTPDDEEKYLHMDFDGRYDISGTPFIDKDCSMDPESGNIIIYGHNMLTGTAFGPLMDYAEQEYWEEHPTVSFTTLYEEREYEILAAFYDRVYYKYEDVFKFYQFIDAEDEEHFNYAMESYREKALYDTGVTAEYGDRLITLVTCSYHHEYGRFVVVAREMTEEPVEDTVPATE